MAPDPAGHQVAEDDELVTLRDEFYILATSSRADDRTRVLKHGDTFGVFDRWGDVQPVGLREQGLYHGGTRHLSRLELRLGRRRPQLLGSTIKEDNDLLTVDLGNPDLEGPPFVARGLVHLFRSKFLWDGGCHERIRITNHGLQPLSLELSLIFDADFADIFEVRGTRRARRGERLPDVVESAALTLSYRGLDQVVRRTRIALDPAPALLHGGGARLVLQLAPGATATQYLRITCDDREEPPTYDEAWTALQSQMTIARQGRCTIVTSSEEANAWLRRSAADLDILTTQTEHGAYPYAGVPWFSTPFGRDGIITALELLWIAPDVSRGVLRTLAALQASSDEPDRDAQPGKILHEARSGEMAALHEVPFGRYYGSVDATPLFIMLAGAYYRRTADRALLEELWPAILRALEWIERHGDVDGDGFVEYARRAGRGLVQQGWKDSHDSVFHQDGTLAEPPIALVEVQGYVYAAWRAAAGLAATMGDLDRAEALVRRAHALQDRFEKAFWCEDLSTYALALDGAKRPCRVVTSNAGHALWTGIASRDHARRVADTLLGEPCFSGWGIRTVAWGQPRYNPMSYHDGSVWPHDNAVIAAGLQRYRLHDAVLRVMEGLFRASVFLDLHRMPELFCGFPTRAGEGPTLYPVACAPQAWAAAAVFMLFEACLGASIDGRQREVAFHQPTLPPSLQQVTIKNLRVGEAELDLQFQRSEHDVGLTVLRRHGTVRIVMVK